MKKIALLLQAYIASLEKKFTQSSFSSKKSSKISFNIISYTWGLFAIFYDLLYDLCIRKLYRVNARVISVGNIAIGGTGKTQMVACLLDLFECKSISAAVILRGYKGVLSSKKPVIVNPEIHSFVDVGDEALMLSSKFPNNIIIICKKKVKGVALAARLGAKIVILDDGFQSRSVHRDCDILMLDSHLPIGNGMFFPSGRLRSRVSSIKRANVIVSIGDSSENINSVMAMVGSKAPVLLARSTFVNIIPYDRDLRGQRIGIFCGLGNPQKFKDTVISMGAEIIAECILHDHEVISPKQLEILCSQTISNNGSMIICSEKDFIKLDYFKPECCKLFIGALVVNLEISDRELLNNVINQFI